MSCASMKGQFIRSCSGRQNILPQCFTDCLDEEWEHISAVPGPGLGRAGAEAGAAPSWHSPITVCCKHPWGSWIRGTRGWRGDGGDGGNESIYISTKAGSSHDYKSIQSFFKLFSDCLLQFYQQTHHTDKTLQLRAIILLVTRTFTRGEKCAEFLIMFSLINH